MTAPLLGELFAGIGGLALAAEEAFGSRSAWHVDADPFGTAVRRRHWPGVPQLAADVRTLGRQELGRVDGLIGGFPCQDLSLAGNQAGLDGARSGLYRELLRLAVELRPDFVAVENVPPLFKYRERFEEDLAAAGFGRVAWARLAASDVGAPHRRKRVFVIAQRSAVRESFEGGPNGNVGSWPTPMAADDGKHGIAFKLGNPTLRGAVGRLWSTPLAGDADGGRTSAGKDRGPTSLRSQIKAASWPMPVASDAASAGSRSLKSSSAHAGTSLTDALRADRAIAGGPIGAAASGATLNPRWVEALQGFPIGWTEAAPDQGRLFGGFLPSLRELPPLRWPAGRGEPQHAWEPPRHAVEAEDRDERGARIRALGNAVVWPQGFVGLRIAWALLHGQDPAEALAEALAELYPRPRLEP